MPPPTCRTLPSARAISARAGSSVRISSPAEIGRLRRASTAPFELGHDRDLAGRSRGRTSRRSGGRFAPPPAAAASEGDRTLPKRPSRLSVHFFHISRLLRSSDPRATPPACRHSQECALNQGLMEAPSRGDDCRSCHVTETNPERGGQRPRRNPRRPGVGVGRWRSSDIVRYGDPRLLAENADVDPRAEELSRPGRRHGRDLPRRSRRRARGAPDRRQQAGRGHRPLGRGRSGRRDRARQPGRPRERRRAEGGGGLPLGARPVPRR